MSWPLSHDYNEAVQNPKLVFSDPDLKAGEAVVGARGLPLPRSGNFADVYQIRGADGRDWAVKCFTRPVVGLAERYARVSEALAQAKLPFVVGFTFLPEGIRVGGVWRPAVKMEWVEGLLLNQVVRENAGRPPVLAAFGQMWVRLCKRLREAKIAHADLQHGNVLFVPGSRPGAYGLKLIDYDGMYVPALANQPSGEVGHAAYQHPARAATRAYSPDLDRFPHLVVLTALKGLEVAGGSALWERYDNGDNLLFTEDDFKKPGDSKLMRELWRTDHSAVQALVGRLAVACGKPIPQTPWIDEVAPEGGDPRPLDNDTRKAAAAALGVALPVPAALPPEPAYGAAAQPVVVPLPAEPSAVTKAEEVDVELVEERKAERKAEPKAGRARPTYRPRPATAGASSSRVLLIVGGILLLVGGVVAAVVLSQGGPPDTVQKPDETDPKGGGVGPKDKEPKEKEPKEKEPKEKEPKEKEPKDKNTNPPPVKPLDLKPVGKLQAKEGWTAELGPDAPLVRVTSSLDSKLAVVAGIKIGSSCFDATTGTQIPGSVNKVFSVGRGAIPLDGGRFAVPQITGDAPIPIWSPKAKQFGDPLKPIEGIGRVPGRTAVSRDARYQAFASIGPGNTPDAPAPFKLAEAATGKVLLELDLVRGQAFFTADASRVLVAERTGRCRWFKLPSGEPDGEWTFRKPPVGLSEPIAISADGAVVFHEGRLGESAGYHHLLNGQTGEVVRSFAGQYMTQRGSSMTDDGRLVALVKREANRFGAIDVIESATGDVVAHLTAPAGKEFLTVELLCDGSAVLTIAGELSPMPERVQALVRYDLSAAGVKPKDPPVTYPTVPVVPGQLHPRWIVDADLGRDSALIHVDPAAGVVLVGNPIAKHAAFDLRTGNPHAGFAELGKNGVAAFFPLDGGRVGTTTQSAFEIQVWDAKAGKPAGLVDVPEIPPGLGHAKPLRAALSPDGKYLAVGRAGVAVADNPEVPLRVFDAATNKELVSTTWRGGSMHFTADSSRMLVAEWSGRVRWFKLPSGEPDGGWDFGPPPAGQRHLVYGVSGDGAVVAYKGPAGLKANESWPGVVNGKTGEVTRRFARHFFASDVALSADGRRAALLLDVAADACTFDVVDVRTGDSLSSLRLTTGRAVPSFALSPDGTALYVHDPAKNKLHRLDVIPPK